MYTGIASYPGILCPLPIGDAASRRRPYQRSDVLLMVDNAEVAATCVNTGSHMITMLLPMTRPMAASAKGAPVPAWGRVSPGSLVFLKLCRNRVFHAIARRTGGNAPLFGGFQVQKHP